MLVMLAFLVLMVMFVFQTRLVVVFVTFKSLLDGVMHIGADGVLHVLHVLHVIVVFVVSAGFPQSDLLWIPSCISMVFMAILSLLVLMVKPCLVFLLSMVMIFTFASPATSVVLHVSVAGMITETTTRGIPGFEFQDVAFVIVSSLLKNLPQCCDTDEGTTHLQENILSEIVARIVLRGSNLGTEPGSL